MLRLGLASDVNEALSMITAVRPACQAVCPADESLDPLRFDWLIGAVLSEEIPHPEPNQIGRFLPDLHTRARLAAFHPRVIS